MDDGGGGSGDALADCDRGRMVILIDIDSESTALSCTEIEIIRGERVLGDDTTLGLPTGTARATGT